MRWIVISWNIDRGCWELTNDYAYSNHNYRTYCKGDRQEAERKAEQLDQLIEAEFQSHR